MKLISDEDIAKQNIPLFKWGTQEYLHTIHGISLGRKAQLEACEKEILEQRLDRPELREKMWKVLLHLVVRDDDAINADEALDKILAFTPDNHLICKAKLAVAKKEAQEKVREIFEEIENTERRYIRLNDDYLDKRRWWQALKQKYLEEKT